MINRIFELWILIEQFLHSGIKSSNNLQLIYSVTSEACNHEEKPHSTPIANNRFDEVEKDQLLLDNVDSDKSQ